MLTLKDRTTDQLKILLKKKLKKWSIRSPQLARAALAKEIQEINEEIGRRELEISIK